MKGIAVVLVVLSIAAAANAGLVVTGTPETPIIPSEPITFGVSVVGTELADQPVFLIVSGPGTLNADAAVNYVVEGGVFIWSGDPADGAVFMDLVLPVIGATLPVGQVVDGITLHCEGWGDLVLTLVKDYSGAGQGLVVMDSIVIHAIPEPMTLSLLGLGGLFLRRRSK
jgi:hypothetical protein